MVGEVYLLDTHLVAPYYGDDDELHLSFNFPPLYARWTAEAWREQIETTTGLLDPIGAWPTWVLSNHDNPRHRTRYGSEERARAAAMLLLGLRGTPFLYAGEELGPARRRDPARPGRRPGRPRRLPGPDPVGPDPRPRLAGRPVAAVPARGRHPQRRRRVGRPPLDAQPLPAVPRRPPGVGRAPRRRPAPAATCPDGVLGWMRAGRRRPPRRARELHRRERSTSTAPRPWPPPPGGTVEVASDRRRRGRRLRRPPRPRPGRLAPPPP